MARGNRFAGRGGLQAPKRQIANDGFGGFGTLTFGASATATALGSIGAVILEPALTVVRLRGIFAAAVTVSAINTNVIRVVPSA